MGAFFGVVSKQDAIADVFFGTDYHCHLGTKRGGMAAYDKEKGLQREIHDIENSPFKTKFEKIGQEMVGNSAIGCISDTDPEPLLIKSKLGVYAIGMVGVINNSEAIINEYLDNSGAYLDSMSNGAINQTELIASLINQKANFADGIRYAQQKIDGTASIIILKDNGNIIAARDINGRIPVIISKNENGYCTTFECFAADKLGYSAVKELGPGEIVELTADNMNQLAEPLERTQICTFLWTYYGYPTSRYENENVEVMRYRNGKILAEADRANGFDFDLDYVCGVPDSGTPHAIGYANESGVEFARAFIKYTPSWARSFTPSIQAQRNKVAKMKLIPVHELINGKKLLFVDDSIVRGTQLRETVDFLYENGAKEVHVRLACPPIMFACKYLNFTRSNGDMDLIARKIMDEIDGDKALQFVEEYADAKTYRGKQLRQKICALLNLKTIEFQSLDGLLKATGVDYNKLCTYCWNGKE